MCFQNNKTNKIIYIIIYIERLSNKLETVIIIIFQYILTCNKDDFSL